MSRRPLTEREFERGANRLFEGDWSDDEEDLFHCEDSPDENYSPTDSDTKSTISTHDCSSDDEMAANEIYHDHEII
ncbi:hypothetical protein QE152_g35172 [Popillia japonica]|uniref:Uncharacterized protein n=1 Tax=Popillia japonica TaxID=7064 RepID=A0AAW1IFK2_POPJA